MSRDSTRPTVRTPIARGPAPTFRTPTGARKSKVSQVARIVEAKKNLQETHRQHQEGDEDACSNRRTTSKRSTTSS